MAGPMSNECSMAASMAATAPAGCCCCMACMPLREGLGATMPAGHLDLLLSVAAAASSEPAPPEPRTCGLLHILDHRLNCWPCMRQCDPTVNNPCGHAAVACVMHPSPMPRLPYRGGGCRRERGSDVGHSRSPRHPVTEPIGDGQKVGRAQIPNCYTRLVFLLKKMEQCGLGDVLRCLMLSD